MDFLGMPIADANREDISAIQRAGKRIVTSDSGVFVESYYDPATNRIAITRILEVVGGRK